jgi:hypothetical protein
MNFGRVGRRAYDSVGCKACNGSGITRWDRVEGGEFTSGGACAASDMHSVCVRERLLSSSPEQVENAYGKRF